ncbi:MAG: hypothetical protein LBU65_10415 [Planctomycetaceae bacterium]|jgi:hypothetical protein|nr:hypothetical protein [Planctomycetaceae bacterium]
MLNKVYTIAFTLLLVTGLFAQQQTQPQQIPYHEPVIPEQVRNSRPDTAPPIETEVIVGAAVRHDDSSNNSNGGDDSQVVTGEFVAAENASNNIKQVQFGAAESGQPPRVASSGRTAAAANTGGATAQESQINAMIGAKFVQMQRPQELPGGHNQIWRVYDITPYTQQRGIDPATKPEQTIIDWIIRQTGDKTWHSEPVGFLNATPEKIYVYHTLDVHRRVAEIIDRFVNPNAAGEGFTFRLISVGSPDWLTRAHSVLQPITTQTPGVQGWVVERGNYPAMMQDLAKRSDYREHCPPQYLIPNGCRYQVVRSRPRSYLRDVQASAQAPGYINDTQTVDEGLSFDFVPLTCLDGVYTDVMLNIAIVQVDQMLPITVELPTQDNPRARHTIETPLIVPFKLDGQIRWLKDRILILDLGMQPLPEVVTGETKGIISGIKKATATGANRGRADYLLFIEKAK